MVRSCSAVARITLAVSATLAPVSTLGNLGSLSEGHPGCNTVNDDGGGGGQHLNVAGVAVAAAAT